MDLECGPGVRQPPWGITPSLFEAWRKQRGLTPLPVDVLSESLAQSFAYNMYWLPCQCPSLPDKIDYVVFQSDYNIGQGWAAKMLQEGLHVTADGIIGPITLNAARHAEITPLVVFYLKAQNKYYRSIDSAKNAKWENGWHDRVKIVAHQVEVVLPKASR